MRATSVSVVLGLLLVAATVQAESNLTLTFDQRRDEKDMKVYVAANPQVNGLTANYLLTKMELAPCGVRTMHLHTGVDELTLVASGQVTVEHVYMNGTIVTDTIGEDQAFAQPKNSVHQVVNPSCTERAVIYNFFNAFDTQTVPVSAHVFKIPTSPFRAYAEPGEQQNSTVAALDYFSYSPECLKKCKLGTTFGQVPATNNS